MNRAVIYILLISLLTSCSQTSASSEKDFETRFETSSGTETATYAETIDFYKRLAKAYSSIHLQTMGETDSGEPLHVVTYSPKADFNFDKLRDDHTMIMVNNGIHPGESDGIDAPCFSSAIWPWGNHQHRRTP